MFIPLFIQGPKDPTKNLNIYFSPLIDELKVLLHNGGETYDRFSQSNFYEGKQMWMIRDFAALDKLKGRHEVRVAPLNSDDEIL